MSKIHILFFLISFLFFISCGNERDNNQEKTDNTNQLSELELLNKKILNDSTNAELYNLRAIYYLQNNNINKALRNINKAIQINPQSSDLYLTLSDIYLLMGEIQKCRKSLLKAENLNSKNTNAILKLAELSLILKDYKKTYEYIDKAIKIYKINPLAYYIRGFALLEAGDTSNAIKNFQIAVDQNQDYYDAIIQLGVIYSVKHNKLAVDYFNNALKIKPRSIEALYNLGMFYQEKNDYMKASEYYQNIIQIDSTFKDAYYNIGYLNLVYINDFKTAAEYFSKTINIDPYYVNAYYNRAYCYELSGNLAEARKDYHKTLELETNYQKAIDGLNRLDKIYK